MSNLRLPDNHPSMVPSSPPSPSPSGVHDGTPIGPSASGRPSELSQQSGGDVAPSPSREAQGGRGKMGWQEMRKETSLEWEKGRGF